MPTRNWNEIKKILMANKEPNYIAYADNEEVNFVVNDLKEPEHTNRKCNFSLSENSLSTIQIDRVIFNDPATIIFWKHWTTTWDPITKSPVRIQDKTVVKCAKGEKFNKYNGFCAAVTKYLLGTNSAIMRAISTAEDTSRNTKPKADKNVKEKTKKGSKKK